MQIIFGLLPTSFVPLPTSFVQFRTSFVQFRSSFVFSYSFEQVSYVFEQISYHFKYSSESLPTSFEPFEKNFRRIVPPTSSQVSKNRAANNNRLKNFYNNNILVGTCSVRSEEKSDIGETSVNFAFDKFYFLWKRTEVKDKEKKREERRKNKSEEETISRELWGWYVAKSDFQSLFVLVAGVALASICQDERPTKARLGNHPHLQCFDARNSNSKSFVHSTIPVWR